jgi:hypothetical protein
MTDTTPHPDAIWPEPDGTRLTEKAPSGLGRVVTGLEDLEQAVMDLVDGRPVQADEAAHAVYVHDLAYLVDHLESAIDRAKSIQAEAAEALAKALPFGTPRVAYPGLRPLTPRWGGERKKWANDLLQEKVKPRLLVDPETGEKRSPEGVLDAVLSVVSLIGSNVKTTGLKALGLDPNDYCQMEKKPPTVQVTKDALDR